MIIIIYCDDNIWPLESVRDDFRYSFDGHRTGELGQEEEDEDDQHLEDEIEEATEDEIGSTPDDIKDDYDEDSSTDHSKPSALETTTLSLLNKRKQSTYFNALRAEDDPMPIPEHPLRFPPREMELFQDAPVRIASRRPPFRHQRNLRKRRRRHLTSLPTFEYHWLRNNEPLDLEGAELFELDKEGTLRISYSEQAPGIYRCVINGTRWGFGALVSRESNVTLAGEWIVEDLFE